MRKRLFLLFFPLMFLPAVVVMFVGWQTSERQLEVLDSPGLHRSLDSSLELARLVLKQQEDRAQQLADSLAGDTTARPGPPFTGPLNDLAARTWWLWPPQPAGNGLSPAEIFPDFAAGHQTAPVRRALPAGSFLLASARLDQQPEQWLVVAEPLPPELVANLDAVAQGSSGLRQMNLFYGRLLRSNALLTLGVLVVLLLGLSLWLSTFLSRRLAAPLQKLVAGTEKVAAGDLSHQVDVAAPDELGHLVGAFNRMTRQLQASKHDLRRVERIAAWQGVARRLAHEIKNPLTPITLAMHRISRKSDDKTVNECVAAVLEEAANLERLADEFSLYAKLPTPNRQPLDRQQLRELVDGVARLYLERTRVQFSWQGWQDDFIVLVDPGQLRQVVSNLVKNGSEAMAGEGVLTFGLHASDGPAEPDGDPSATSGGWISFSVADTGPGLPADPESVFEPYVTDKATGTGLGLAIARRIIDDNGGRLTATSTTEGAVFTIELPNTA